MDCQNCGKQNEEGVEVCQFCGEALDSNSDNVLIEINESAIKSTSIKKNGLGSRKSPLGGDEKTFILVSGCFLLLIGVLVVSIYFLLRGVLSSVSDWSDDFLAQYESTQTSRTSIEEVTEVVDPARIEMEQEIYGESEILYYGVKLETTYYPVFNHITHLELVGMNKLIFASNPDGLSPVYSNPEAGLGYISSDRRTVAVLSDYSRGELLLFGLGEAEPFFRSQDHSLINYMLGFSADGKYYGYSSYGLDPAMHYLGIVDVGQRSNFKIADLLFGTFVPDSNLVVVYRIRSSDDTITGLELVDIETQESTALVELNLNINDVYIIAPFTSLDGNLIYYIDGDDLVSFSRLTEEIKPIYTFEFKDEARTLRLKDSDLVAIVDGEDPDLASLFLYNPHADDIVKIDHRVSTVVFHYPQRYSANISSIAFSPDRKHIAYPGGQIGNMELRIADLDGGNVTQLSKRAEFLSFKFSPDNEHIAYLDLVMSFEVGDLYITDFKGENRWLVDENVVSYQFIVNGDYLIYSQIENLSDETPVSSIYRIGINGEGRTLIFQEVGMVVFINVP